MVRAMEACSVAAVRDTPKRYQTGYWMQGRKTGQDTSIGNDAGKCQTDVVAPAFERFAFRGCSPRRSRQGKAGWQVRFGPGARLNGLGLSCGRYSNTGRCRTAGPPASRKASGAHPGKEPARDNLTGRVPGCCKPDLCCWVIVRARYGTYVSGANRPTASSVASARGHDRRRHPQIRPALAR